MSGLPSVHLQTSVRTLQLSLHTQEGSVLLNPQALISNWGRRFIMGCASSKQAGAYSNPGQQVTAD